MLSVKEHPFIPTTKDHRVFWTQMDKPLREFLEICGRNRVGFIHLEKEKLPT